MSLRESFYSPPASFSSMSCLPAEHEHPAAPGPGVKPRLWGGRRAARGGGMPPRRTQGIGTNRRRVKSGQRPPLCRRTARAIRHHDRRARHQAVRRAKTAGFDRPGTAGGPADPHAVVQPRRGRLVPRRRSSGRGVRATGSALRTIVAGRRRRRCVVVSRRPVCRRRPHRRRRRTTSRPSSPPRRSAHRAPRATATRL